jgi:ubiquitin C-terminal hydrolase
LYSLYGIANHSGTIDFGHYFAYIKIEGNWFEFNDSIVKSIGRINNISSSAYVFFYKRNDI